MNTTGTHELRIAEEIVSVLPAGSWMRLCTDERDTIRYAVRVTELPLRSVILNRASLQRLIADPAGAVKVEYLQRELREAAAHRAEFRYPRVVEHPASATEAGAPSPQASVL
jgi:hypothetical protein